MAKHRTQQTSNTRRIVAASAAVAGMTTMAPAAGAAEVVIPNTDIRVNVEGIEDVPGIADVPNVEQYIPSLKQQSVYKSGAPAAHQAPAAQPSNSSNSSSAQTSTGQAIVDAARSRTGSPYGWGSAGPSSFDCSGLTSWAYQQVGKSIPRTSQAQAAAGQQVSLNNLQPGDIVVYYSGASHVGIYTGNGTIIDSLNSGTTVAERPLHYMPIHSAVRF